MSIELGGLDGRNPMAYFAAIGALVGADRMSESSVVELSWRDGPIPRPVLHGVDRLDALVALLEADRQAWAEAPAIQFEGAEDVKFDADAQRRYLRACRAAADGGRSAGLASALVAEGVFAGKGDGKPTDLHFSAGQQRFLVIARELQKEVDGEHLSRCMAGPWAYRSAMKTFGWDMSDDRIYALSVSNPAKDTKMTEPGADWLALMGLAAFPAVADGASASPPGSTGSWKRGTFEWGLWSKPLQVAEVRAVIASGWAPYLERSRVGLFRRMRSAIRRSDQGGYGSFGPSSVVWAGEM